MLTILFVTLHLGAVQVASAFLAHSCRDLRCTPVLTVAVIYREARNAVVEGKWGSESETVEFPIMEILPSSQCTAVLAILALEVDSRASDYKSALIVSMR